MTPAVPASADAFVQYGALGLLAFVLVVGSTLARSLIRNLLREQTRQREVLEHLNKQFVYVRSDLERIRIAAESYSFGERTPRETPRAILRQRPADSFFGSAPTDPPESLSSEPPSEEPAPPRRRMPSRSGE